MFIDVHVEEKKFILNLLAAGLSLEETQFFLDFLLTFNLLDLDFITVCLFLMDLDAAAQLGAGAVNVDALAVVGVDAVQNLSEYASKAMQITPALVQGIHDFSSIIYFFFRVDILGLLFVTLNIFLMFLCIYSLLPMMSIEPQIRLYTSLLLMVMGLLNIVFLAADLFTFFVAFEAVLIPIILIISI